MTTHALTVRSKPSGSAALVARLLLVLTECMHVSKSMGVHVKADVDSTSNSTSPRVNGDLGDALTLALRLANNQTWLPKCLHTPDLRSSCGGKTGRGSCAGDSCCKLVAAAATCCSRVDIHGIYPGRPGRNCAAGWPL